MYMSKSSYTTYRMGDFPVPFVHINAVYNRGLYEDIKNFLESSYPDSELEDTNNDGILTRFTTSDEVLDCGIRLEEQFGIPYKE